ncbi:MAG TPA: VIT domain-containing protein [Puia sp.]|nr:VIT domain-containing protein [Puia sp.]
MNTEPNKYLLASLLLLQGMCFSLRAQVPSIKVEGKESGLVYLQKLNIDVSINGSIATTTWTMTFKNKTARILEGELGFPLAEGISVSGYALDINGRLREAVPVEKEKGTRVFENIERRRVDPGLLEKVDGNGFRTRIYPINPNGARTVLIRYEEELAWSGQSSLLYHLPLAFQRALEEFNINISVVRGTQKPVFEGNIDNELRFNEWNDTWSASRSWKNYLADRSLTIRIPKTTGASEVMMQQAGNHYFYVLSTFPVHKKIEKPLPKKITILWDASLSSLSRNTEKELDLLDQYFDKLQDAEIRLVNFSNTVQEAQTFTLHNGQWDRLHDVLQHTVYDGATQFGSLDLRKYPCDEFLLFSDGHSTFGNDQLKEGGKPVYAIVATPKADFPFLRAITDASGGELINLLTTTTEQAWEQLCYQSLYFMGVKASANLQETYPSLPSPVVSSLSVAGISYQPEQRLVLQFGYGGKVTSESTITLDYTKQQTSRPDLSRIWAQKKIAQLDRRFEDNQTEIEQLGRRYGIVTRNTSLIVLENVNDYITYEIEPPAELREEYDRIMKQRGQADRQLRHTTVDNAEVYFNELLHWWQTDYKRPVKNKTLPPPAPIPGPPATAPALAEQALEGRAPGLSVSRNRRNEPSPSTIRGTSNMDEVVVVGYATVKKKSITGSVTTIDDKDLEAAEPESSANGNHSPSANNNSSGYGTFKAWKADIQTEYLTRLQAARPAEQYAVYLQMRKKNLHTPLFYFNTANFFFETGKKNIGLRILSNIAELDAESYEIYKLLGYKLKELGETEAACAAFKKILDWRPFEPQSYRDYGLALEDAGQYQQALDTLYAALVKNYDANVSALYPGIEETILPEINNLVARKADKIDFSRIPKQLLTNMPVDIRVVLNWNMNDTDIDLWVTDPDDEKCYYSHRNTAIGGRISHDFTRGLGPEQFMLKRAIKGKYKVEVNYYGDSQMKIAGPTTIMVEIYTNYGTPAQTRKLITLQMQSTAQGTVYVGDFDF